jgi:hypothetical protein
MLTAGEPSQFKPSNPEGTKADRHCAWPIKFGGFAIKTAVPVSFVRRLIRQWRVNALAARA